MAGFFKSWMRGMVRLNVSILPRRLPQMVQSVLSWEGRREGHGGLKIIVTEVSMLLEKVLIMQECPYSSRNIFIIIIKKYSRNVLIIQGIPFLFKESPSYSRNELISQELFFLMSLLFKEWIPMISSPSLPWPAWPVS